MKNDEQLVDFKYYDRINKEFVMLKIPYSMKKELAKMKQEQKRETKKFFDNTISLEIVLDNEPELLPVDNNTPEKIMFDEYYALLDKILLEQKRTIVENALCELTDKQREIVELRFYDNLSYSKISLQLGISKTAVINRFKNAVNNIINYIIRTQN